MTTLSYADPTIGVGFDTQAPVVDAALQAIRAWANGNVDGANLATALLAQLGVTGGGTTRRGSATIATPESRTNTAYGLMPTPDRVQGISLPSPGLLFVVYEATWSSTVASAGRAAMFLNSNQVKFEALPSPVVQEATTPAGSLPTGLATSHAGLVSDNGGSGLAYTGDVTTGQIVGALTGPGNFYGGATILRAAAGSYDVSVQFKATSGSVAVQSRNLYVWTAGF